MRLPRARLPRDWPLLGLLLLVGIVPLGILVGEALSEHGALTGATGVFPADQFQYMAWIRDAGEHGLAASKFDLVAARHVLLDPIFALSALLWRIGLSVQLAYLALFPVGLAVLFGGYRAYVRRTLPDSLADRATALALALFFATPVLALLVWGPGLGTAATSSFFQLSVDTTPALQMWGYFPIAVTLGLFAYAMLWIERAVEEPHGGKYALRASLAALLVGWLHPWEGAILIVILLGLVLVGRPLRRYALLAAPAAAAALPLAYFALLPHVDAAWKVAKDQNSLATGAGWAMVLGALGPLAVLAAGRPRLAGLSVQGRILLIWPLGALFVYWVAPPYPIHALETVSLPLAVLAMRGWRFVPARRTVLTGAALLLTVPGVVFAATKLQRSAQLRRTAYILPRDDARAFAFIDRLRVQGGVLAPLPQAFAVPALTDRETWIGHPSWTPAFDERVSEAADLFAGRMPQGPAMHRVMRIGAPIVFAPCESSRKLAAELAPVSSGVWRFGCATVWRISGVGVAVEGRGGRKRGA